MGQELRLDGHASLFSLSDRFVEMSGIPVSDDGGEQVEPRHALMLAFAGAVAEFTFPPDAQCVLWGAVCYAFVQACVGLALHIGTRQAAHDEERSCDPARMAGNSPVYSHGCKCLRPVAEWVAGKPGCRTLGRI